MTKYCDYCHGDGSRDGETCPACKGSGYGPVRGTRVSDDNPFDGQGDDVLRAARQAIRRTPGVRTARDAVLMQAITDELNRRLRERSQRKGTP